MSLHVVGVVLYITSINYTYNAQQEGRSIGGDNLIESSQVSAYSYILYMKHMGNSYTMMSWALASFYY